MALSYSHSLPRPVGNIIDKQAKKEGMHHCPRGNSYLQGGSNVRRSRESTHPNYTAKPPLKPHSFDLTWKYTM